MGLTDREVGELWSSLHRQDWHIAWLSEDIRDAVLSLIRKLVEERKANHMDNAEYGYPNEQDALSGALRDFHISPDDWGKED